jgi:hypothetical protein
MSAIPPSPRFFQQPLRYLKWASINKPAYFFSIIVGCTGPIMVLTVPPIRRYLGEEQRPKIPMTYPSTFTDVEWRRERGWLGRLGVDGRDLLRDQG